jgi:hypothetical protein
MKIDMRHASRGATSKKLWASEELDEEIGRLTSARAPPDPQNSGQRGGPMNGRHVSMQESGPTPLWGGQMS